MSMMIQSVTNDLPFEDYRTAMKQELRAGLQRLRSLHAKCCCEAPLKKDMAMLNRCAFRRTLRGRRGVPAGLHTLFLTILCCRADSEFVCSASLGTMKHLTLKQLEAFWEQDERTVLIRQMFHEASEFSLRTAISMLPVTDEESGEVTGVLFFQAEEKELRQADPEQLEASWSNYVEFLPTVCSLLAQQ